MRVLHVVPSLDRAQGGPSKVVPELAAALVKQGLSVDIATTTGGDEEGIEAEIRVGACERVMPVHGFRRQRSGSYAFSWQLREWLRRNVADYDVVHVNGAFSYPPLAASRIARRMKKPYVISPHGMLDVWALRHKAWKKAPYMKLVERQTLTNAAALHALAANEKSSFDALRLNAPAFILPNGIDVEEFAALPAREVFEARCPEVRGKKIVLFLGRIDYKKGLDFLIKAYAQVVRAAAQNSSCLVLAGPDLVGYRATIEELIRAEGIGGDVVFAGMLSGEVKLAALDAADVFVLPSRSEGFSVAVLESLAAGCPVIITEACNFPQVTKAGVGKVIPAGVEPLQQALAEMLSDDQRRLAMGARAKKFVKEEYDWATIAARMCGVYEDILRGHRSSDAWNV